MKFRIQDSTKTPPHTIVEITTSKQLIKKLEEIRENNKYKEINISGYNEDIDGNQCVHFQIIGHIDILLIIINVLEKLRQLNGYPHGFFESFIDPLLEEGYTHNVFQKTLGLIQGVSYKVINEKRIPEQPKRPPRRRFILKF